MRINRKIIFFFWDVGCSGSLPIGNLEVWTSDALDESLEEFVDEVFQLIDFADLENLEQLCEEHDFLMRVCEGPVSE